MEIISTEKRACEKYDEIFDAGERFEKVITNLPKDNPRINDTIERLRRNVVNYKKAYQAIERIRYSDRNNIDISQIEESDRSRKVYHDGIISCIELLAKEFPDNIYFQNLSNQERDKVGEEMLLIGKYLQLQEQIHKKAA